MLPLSLLSCAMAAMPVYILNSDSVAPKGYKLDASHFNAVVAHFLGDHQLASQEAIEAAQFVPGTFMDSRSSNVVVLTEFDVEAATDLLGSSLFEVTPDSNSEYVDQGVPLTGTAALQAIESLENKDQARVLVRAGPDQKSLLEALVQLDSKALILGVPAGDAVPAFTSASKHGKKETKPKPKAPSPLPYDSLDKCKSATDNCSGHGECVKSNGGYQCLCKPSKKNGYTTYWGGYSCEKQDISWQFNLLFWTGAGIILSIIAGVSMLFSIGSQPLPGVLSAST